MLFPIFAQQSSSQRTILKMGREEHTQYTKKFAEAEKNHHQELYDSNHDLVDVRSLYLICLALSFSYLHTRQLLYCAGIS